MSLITRRRALRCSCTGLLYTLPCHQQDSAPEKERHPLLQPDGAVPLQSHRRHPERVKAWNQLDGPQVAFGDRRWSQSGGSCQQSHVHSLLHRGCSGWPCSHWRVFGNRGCWETDRLFQFHAHTGTLQRTELPAALLICLPACLCGSRHCLRTFLNDHSQGGQLRQQIRK